MAEIVPGLRATRMELLALRRRKTLAERGHDLLQEKQDALVMEFFEFIREIGPLRNKLDKTLLEAYAAFTEAQMVVGIGKLRQIALSTSFDRFDIGAKTRSVMGIPIPIFNVTETASLSPTEHYDIIETTAKLDESVLKVDEAMKTMITLAETEVAVRRLAEAIATTKRRVNCLKHIIIPKFENSIRFIEMYLEEREREEFFRLKRMKSALERAEKEATPVYAVTA